METEFLSDKSQVIESFGTLPDQVTADQLIEPILFIRSINERIQEARTTSGKDHATFMNELKTYMEELKASKESR
ncbi:hypothetical protein [Arsenicibacter rosenii]|uniref:Uncharacterized protein n=1 Tax=Arsenicibacter rosenii TaxID=1750698 RepID=A0A1S2VPH7_9BACT|nr:hypothetical protein [Arsenicibacter rosenii]OIN60677.1 hypothetical protein BLX24_00750 [Arsenicibacter rosenii]